MQSDFGATNFIRHQWLWMASLTVALINAPAAGRSAPFQEPKVFASSAGVLDLLMIAKPMPVTTISFDPPDGGNLINPIGWVYEICPRSEAVGNACPVGASTVADYGGVRLALQPGDSLKIRLVNKLPPIDPLKAKHSQEPGRANIPLNPTNLHTHGLIVPPRTPTLSDPTFGDFIFVEIYNSANGTPVPQLTHQHGSIKMDFADYRIDIPANHPPGLFWFHPHVHGLTLNQLASGMSGILTIGNVQDYVVNPPGVIRHLMLKDMQVLDAGTLEFDLGTVTVVDGEVQHQQAASFCEEAERKGPPGVRLGVLLRRAPRIRLHQ